MALKGKTRGREEEDDGDSPFMPIQDVLRKLKQGPLNFGLYQTTDKNRPVLLAAHKRKNAEMLGKQAKKEAGTSKGSFGTVSLDGAELVFECASDNVPRSLTKKVRLMLKAEGFGKFKARVMLPGGAELGETDEDEDEDESAAPEAGNDNAPVSEDKASAKAAPAGGGQPKKPRSLAEAVARGAGKTASMVAPLPGMIAGAAGDDPEAAARAARAAQGAQLSAQGAAVAVASAAEAVDGASQAAELAGASAAEAVEQVGPRAAAPAAAAGKAAGAAMAKAQTEMQAVRSEAAVAGQAAQRATQAAAQAQEGGARAAGQEAAAARERAEQVAGRAQAVAETAKSAADRAVQLKDEAVGAAQADSERVQSEAAGVAEDARAVVDRAAGLDEGVVDTVVQEAKSALDSVTGIFSGLARDAGRIGDALIQAVGETVDEAGQMLDTARQYATQAAEKLAQEVQGLFDGAQAAGAALSGVAERSRRIVAETDAEVAEAIRQAGGQIVGALVDPARRELEDTHRRAEEEQGRMETALAELGEGARRLFAGIAEAAEGFIDRATGQAAQAARETFDAAGAALEEIGDKLDGAQEQVRQALARALDEAAALAEWMKQQATDGVEQFAAMAARAPGLEGEAAEQALREAEEVRRNAGGIFTAIAEAARDKAGSLFDSVAEFAAARRDEAEGFIEETIRAIEATKLRFEDQIARQIERATEHAETRVDEARARGAAVREQTAGLVEGLEDGRAELVDEVGEDFAAPGLNAITQAMTARMATNDKAEAVEAGTEAIPGALADLAEQGRQAVDRIIGWISEDAVKAAEAQLDRLAQTAEEGVREVKALADAVGPAFDAARAAAGAEADRLLAEAGELAEAIGKTVGQTAGDAGQLVDGMIDAIREKIAGLTAKQDEAQARAGKVFAKVAEDIGKEIAAQRDREAEAEENIRKATAALQAEVNAFNAATVTARDDAREIQTKAGQAIKQIEDWLGYTTTNFGGIAAAPIQVELEIVKAVDQEREDIRAERIQIRETCLAIEAGLAAVISDPNHAGALARAKEAFTVQLVAYDKAAARHEGMTGKIEAALRRTVEIAQDAQGEFDATEQVVGQHTEAWIAKAQAQFDRARAGDARALAALMDSAARHQENFNALLGECQRRGGSEYERLSVAVRKARVRLDRILDDAATLHALSQEKAAG